MKRSLALAFTLASGIALSAAAQTLPSPATAPAGPAKVAVILFQAAVFQTNEGQRDMADLQKKYAPKETQLKAAGDEIETLTKELQAQGDKLSDAAKAVKAKVIDEKKKQAQRQLEDVQTDYQNEMLEIYNGLASKVYDVLASYAQQQGFTLVVDATQPQQQPPVILWSSPSTDITRPVIEAYNAKSGVPAPPAPVPAAPKPASTAPKPAGGAPAAH